MTSESKQRMLDGALASGIVSTQRAKQKRDLYEANPKLCIKCSSVIPYEKRQNKYCSHSCSASLGNIGVRRHGDAPIEIKCEFCGNSTFNVKFCCNKCQGLASRAKSFEDIRTGKFSSLTSAKIIRAYLLERDGGKCEGCELEKWKDAPIPLDVDHIDGNPTNNVDNNLRLLCKNCHALTPTYGAKNKGSGREYRRRFYRKHGYS